MSIQADAITLKKLVLVKQLYQQALAQAARQGSTVARVMAVVGFDLAVETVLKAVVGGLEPAKTPKDAFQPLIQQADGALSSGGLPPVPDKANVQYVHGIRNDAQHKASYPTDSEVSDSRTYTRDFLQSILPNVWGLSFNDLSLTDLIQNDEVKEHLAEAEAKLNQKDNAGAMNAANIGLTSALQRVERVIVGESSHFIEGLGRDIFATFERMQQTLLYVALGMDYSDYMRFRSIAGSADEMLNGSWTFFGAKEPVDRDNAEFVVGYCIDAVVQIESIVGDLDQPFGRERYQ